MRLKEELKMAKQDEKTSHECDRSNCKTPNLNVQKCDCGQWVCENHRYGDNHVCWFCE
jgi:AN1-like zinc finger protein